jgi:hypothetical protein
VRAAVFREWIALREFVRIAVFLSTAATVRSALDVDNVFVQTSQEEGGGKEEDGGHKCQSRAAETARARSEPTNQPTQTVSFLINVPLLPINLHSRKECKISLMILAQR